MFEIKKRDTYTDTERLLFNILMEVKGLKMALTGPELKAAVKEQIKEQIIEALKGKEDVLPTIAQPCPVNVPTKVATTSRARPKPKSKPKKKG